MFKFFSRQCHALNRDIETDVLVIGNNMTSALTTYLFSEKKISTVVIDKEIIRLKRNRDSILDYESLNLNYFNEVNKMELFKDVLGIVYELDDLNKRLKNKINYTRDPNVSYKTDQVNHDFPLFAGIYYDFGIRLNKSKFIYELLKYLINNNVSMYSQTEVVFYSIDSKKQITVMTNKGYKIKCKKIINTVNNTNLYANVNVNKENIINNFNLTNHVLDNLLNAKSIVNQYLGIKDNINEKTV